MEKTQMSFLNVTTRETGFPSLLRQKKCSRCKQTKEINQFFKDNKSSNGYASNCKSCNYEIKNRIIECACSRFTTVNSYSRHIKSIIHSNLIKTK
jgi:hypothetical protein